MRWIACRDADIASPSDVPSPSQDLAYLVRLAAEAGQVATAASDSNSEDSVYFFHDDDMDSWLQYGLAAFSARQATNPRVDIRHSLLPRILAYFHQGKSVVIYC